MRKLLFLLFYSLQWAVWGSHKAQQILFEAQRLQTQSKILWTSLASNRVQACDGERVTLHCPRHTHVIVDTGFYGRVVPPSELCPSRRPIVATPSSSASLLSHPSHSLTCDVIHAKSKLSEFCDKRRKCTIVVAAKSFDEDPCPGVGKYLQMSYKCRPVSFESASFCEGEQMGVECREGKKLSIHSAIWTRNSEGKCSEQLGNQSNDRQDRGCSRDVLLELLKCHGQSSCSMPLTEDYFGKAKCASQAPYSLHVSFVCVNDEIFSEETLKGDLDYSLHKKYIEGSGSEWEDVKPAILETDKMPSKTGKPTSEMGKSTRRRDEKSSSHEGLIRVHPIRLPTEKAKESVPVKEITVEEHIEHSMRDADSFPSHFSSPPSRGSGPRIHEEPPAILSDSGVKPTHFPESPDVAAEEPNFVGVAHDVFLVAKFFQDHSDEALWAIGIGVAVCVCFPLALCLCLCRASKMAKKSDGKLRYSIETSQLFAKGSQMLDGPSHLVDIGDLPEDTFIRYSVPSSRSTHIHYDF